MLNFTGILYGVSVIAFYATILHFVFTSSPTHANLLLLLFISQKVLKSSIVQQYNELMKELKEKNPQQETVKETSNE